MSLSSDMLCNIRCHPHNMYSHYNLLTKNLFPTNHGEICTFQAAVYARFILNVAMLLYVCKILLYSGC